MDIKDSILKTIAWFDLFDFPLTAEEIMEYLFKYDKPLHIKEIRGTLALMCEEGVTEELKEHFVLKGRGSIVEIRKARKFIAEKLWTRTRLYGQYMRAVPFVRMIAVCNNLAYDNPNEQSDIDLFVVIKPGRMWTARFIITIILQFFGVRRYGDKIAGRFCLSFFVTANKLNMKSIAIKPLDPYLAYWTKLVAPIYGEETYRNFKNENETWIKNEYGLKFPEENKKHMYADRESGLKKFFEWLLGGLIGNLTEGLFKKSFKKKTLRGMKKLGPEASVIVSDDMLKFHNHDKRKEYYERWQKFMNHDS
jgi:hypothetical protein